MKTCKEFLLTILLLCVYVIGCERGQQIVGTATEPPAEVVSMPDANLAAAEVQSLAFSPDGQTLASVNGVGADTRIKLWDVITGRNIATITHDETYFDRVTAISFSPDGQTLISANNIDIRLWDVMTGRNIATIELEDPEEAFGSAYVFSYSFSSDGKTLAFTSSQGGIWLWDVMTGRNIATIELEDPEEGYWLVSFSQDGKSFAATNSNASVPEVQLWDTTGSKLVTFPVPYPGIGSGANSEILSFSPDGTILALGDVTGEIKLWDLMSASSIATLFNEVNNYDQVTALSFSPDGTLLASAYALNAIKLWDVNTGSELATFRSLNFDNYDHFLSFSPDGETLASGGVNGEVRLWTIPPIDDTN